jgi:sulfate adenylyltransferase
VLRSANVTLPISTVEMADLRLLAWGAYAPLDGFMGSADYNGVVTSMRLGSGRLWSLPIAVTVGDEDAAGLEGQAEVQLTTPAGDPVATVLEPELYGVDPQREACLVYGTDDPAHPGAARVLGGGRWRLGGRLRIDRPELLGLPAPFGGLPSSPAEVRKAIEERGWRSVVAFQTRNPIHRAHEYLTKVALELSDGLLIHPLVGDTKGDDVPADVRLRCYHALIDGYYPAKTTLLALFPAPMRYAGPREAVFHALVRANYGATHFIVGRDHAGVGSYYGPFDAQDLLRRLGPEELGLTPVFFDSAFYCRACGQMASPKTCPHDAAHHVVLSGTKVRQMLANGERPPREFSRPEVAGLLVTALREPDAAAAEPAPAATGPAGGTIWLTGLPSAGKSTIAAIVAARLRERGRRVEILDGDEMRQTLTKGLGFSREDRDENIRRIGFVASLLARNGVVVITAAISPYRDARAQARAFHAPGRFLEVHVATPVEVCARRDVKGLYAKQQAGQLRGLSGVDDPYEAPERPELVVPAHEESPSASADRVLAALEAIDEG